jgi:hypothetical protein
MRTMLMSGRNFTVWIYVTSNENGNVLFPMKLASSVKSTWFLKKEFASHCRSKHLYNSWQRREQRVPACTQIVPIANIMVCGNYSCRIRHTFVCAEYLQIIFDERFFSRPSTRSSTWSVCFSACGELQSKDEECRCDWREDLRLQTWRVPRSQHFRYPLYVQPDSCRTIPTRSTEK